MIFAEFTCRPKVEEILQVLEDQFGEVAWGDQGTDDDPDAYFQIWPEGSKGNMNERVQVDNFTSIWFQVKCPVPDNPLIQKVIGVLSESFELKVYDEPEWEYHE